MRGCVHVQHAARALGGGQPELGVVRHHGERQRAHALQSSRFILSFLILCHHVLQTGNRKKMVGKGARKKGGQTKEDDLSAQDPFFFSKRWL